jgi:hypothetical protein
MKVYIWHKTCQRIIAVYPHNNYPEKQRCPFCGSEGRVRNLRRWKRSPMRLPLFVAVNPHTRLGEWLLQKDRAGVMELNQLMCQNRS